MFHNLKRAFWLVIALVIMIAAVRLVTSYRAMNAPKEQTNVTQKYFLPEDAGNDPDILVDVMTDSLKLFPEIYNNESAKEDGIVSIHHGNMYDGTSNLFRTFVTNSSQGKTAQVIVVVYTAEEDPIFKNVYFDGLQYYAVIDTSRDRFHEDSNDYLRIRYDYLIIITDFETGSKFVILTNNRGLTFEMLRDAQIASDMESIDSYQLFSFSE